MLVFFSIQELIDLQSNEDKYVLSVIIQEKLLDIATSNKEIPAEIEIGIHASVDEDYSSSSNIVCWNGIKGCCRLGWGFTYYDIKWDRIIELMKEIAQDQNCILDITDYSTSLKIFVFKNDYS